MITQNLPPIPEVYDATDWSSVPILTSREPLVPLGPSSDYPVLTSAVYFGEHDNSPYARGQLKGSVITMFARESVAKRLVCAEAKLPPDHCLIVLDAWRPLEVQQCLYQEYCNTLHTLNPLLAATAIEAEARKYVCPPSFVPQSPPPHNTGGTIDIAIVKLPRNSSPKTFQAAKERNNLDITIMQHVTMLNFGTPFDWGGAESALRYYEELKKFKTLTPTEEQAQHNRRLLYHTMASVGFVGNPHEWWHFNAPETQIGARTIGSEHATFGGATLSEKNLRHEAKRQSLARSTRLSTRLQPASRCVPQAPGTSVSN